MPARPTKNKSQFATQLDAGLLARFREYAAGRGETLTQATERAIAREMAYPPPPVAIAPLPDADQSKNGKKK